MRHSQVRSDASAVKPLETSPCPDHGFLSRVGGVDCGAQHAITVARQRCAMRFQMLDASRHSELASR